jgi:Ca-activated chloride channel family protein
LGLALLALAVAGAGAGSDGAPATAAEAVSLGLRAFEARDFARALSAFERAITLAPSSPVPRYDAAATLFALKRYDESLARYQEARDRASGALRAKIDFALGNTALGLGDVEAAIGHYDDCLASRAWGAGVSEVRSDAEINRRFAVDLAKRVPRPADDPEGKKPPGTEPKKRPPRDAAKGQGPSGPEPELPEPDESSSAPGGPRGPGGAGGTGSQTPRAGSPEARLAAALEDIRAARRRRLAEAPPTPPAQDNQKNW